MLGLNCGQNFEKKIIFLLKIALISVNIYSFFLLYLLFRSTTYS